MNEDERDFAQTLAMARMITEAHDLRDTPVDELLLQLNTTLAAKSRVVRGYRKYPHPTRPGHHRIVQFSKEAEVDGDYSGKDATAKTPGTGTSARASSSVDQEALVRGLLQDTNKKFPLTEVNARKMLSDYAPPGFEPKQVAGSGGAGADLVFDGPDRKIFRIENKSTTSFRGFDSELAHAAQNQAAGSLVFVQVPKGTDVSKWMARFWGNRSALLREATPENLAKLEVYKNTDVVIVDELGETLLPRQPIYNPAQPGRP